MSAGRTSRCAWAGASPEMIRYHDDEWGVPARDSRRLFELLTLEGAQAGLSWATILRKRAGYRRAFAKFEPARVARFSATDVRRLMRDAGIVRNRLKIEATIANARAVLDVEKEHGSFGAWLWALVGGAPVMNAWRLPSQVPAETPAARGLSRALSLRGFRFVGPTICYAFMQASGMVNDHITTCFRWRQLRASPLEPARPLLAARLTGDHHRDSPAPVRDRLRARSKARRAGRGRAEAGGSADE